MAAVNAYHFVSRTSHVNYGGFSVSEGNQTQIGLRKQTAASSGLRCVNKVDCLNSKSYAKAIGGQLRRKRGIKAGSAKRGEIVCSEGKLSGGMNIVHVTFEVGPWSKTGGLGDVTGGLPPAQAANGHRVMTIAPRHDQYKDAWDTDVSIEIKVGDRVEIVRFFHCFKRGVDRVFVDHPWFLAKVWGKTGSKLYGPRTGIDYQDNQLRFSLFCQAALEVPRILNLNSNKSFSGPYGEDVVFVAHDWHTSLLPCYIKSNYKSKGLYANAKVAYCIHNIAYQGRFAFEDFSLLNLPNSFKSSFDFMDGYNKPVKGRKINWMKAAILEVDRLLTVSPYYAKELVSGEDKGSELANFIRKVGITGITNGMDVQEWNPSTDKYLDVKYDATTVMDAKPLLKEALQAEVGLPVDPKIPVIGFIGRLEEQKGSDILAAAISQFIDQEVQIIVLGTGKKPMEEQLEELEIMYPDKARGITKFNVPLAHMIIAAADFMIIPSRFEPCGLIQLHAMRYGTPCVVASTGGLVDTVKEGFTGFQMGGFNVDCEEVDPADVTAIATTVKRALNVYGTPAMTEMIQNCMAQDFSWKGSAKLWEKVLLSLNVAGSEPGSEEEEIATLAKENVATP